MLSRPKPNFRNSSPINLLVGGLGILLLASCSSAPPKDPLSLCGGKFDKLEQLFQKGKYSSVVDPAEDILNTCHGTGYMEQTQFMLAESYFHMEDWIEARGEYTTFVMNFPSSPYAETAEFRKALSSYNMSYNDMRDESPTGTAVRDFEDFVADYPSSALLDSANRYQDSLADRLAEKEFQIAKLYWRMGHPLASAMYLKTFLSNYPHSSRQYEGQLMLIDCYIKLEQFDPAQTYLDHLAVLFPKSEKDRASRQKDLTKAKSKYEARLKKELQEKQFRKEDAL
ncbi:MAG TPA: outer membrane protein assembly factor BamD [Fibrobacteraceae bacterium]|nr:outer membrane protein assembly factor BamD [Fibrobacteraceae bacterium]